MTTTLPGLGTNTIIKKDHPKGWSFLSFGEFTSAVVFGDRSCIFGRIRWSERTFLRRTEIAGIYLDKKAEIVIQL